MNNTGGSIWYQLGIDNTLLQKDANRSSKIISGIGDTVESEGARIDNIVKRMTSGFASLGATLSAGALVKQIVSVRGEFQQLEIAFETMLGSKGRADALMSQLVDTAAKTPFDLAGVANGAKQLLAYGTTAEDVNDTLVRLGNIASGLSIPLNDMVYLYGTTQVQGRLFTQDVRQFMGRGIPLVQQLALELGKTEGEINDMVTAGKIGFPEVQRVINKLTDEGGMFFNLMEKQSASLTGQIANLEDAWNMMLNDIGSKSEDVFSGAIDISTSLIENYEKVGEALLGLVSMYGAYKGAVIALNLVENVEKSAIIAQYEAEIAELSKLLPAKQASKNSDIEAAVASGKLTEAKAAELIAIRQEIAVKLDEVKANHILATSEHEIALASHKAALQRAIASKAMVSQREMEMSLAKLGGNAAQIELAQKSLLQAQEERHINVKARKASADALAISKSKVIATSTAVETLQQNINNASTSAAVVRTNLLTVAKTKLAAIAKSLQATMLANPYVLATMAAVALGYAIYKLVTYQTDAEKAQSRLNDATKEAEKASLGETRELAKLKGELAAATKGSDEYNTIKEKIVNNYGKYYDGLDKEIQKVGLLEETYNKLTEAIQKSFGARQYESFIKSEQDNLGNIMSENLGKVQDKLIDELGDEAGSKYYAKIRDAIIAGNLDYGKNFYEVAGLDKETQSALDKISGKASNDWIQNYAIEGYIKNIIKAQKLTDEMDKKAKLKFGIEDVDKTKSDGTDTEIKKVKTFAEQVNEAKEGVSKLKTELQNLRSGKTQSSSYAKDIEDKTKELKDAEDKLSYLLTGKASSNKSGESAADKARKQAEDIQDQQEKIKALLDKQTLERKRAEEDLENQASQAGINAMQEGFEKSQKQRELDNKLGLQAIERQKEDYIRAYTQAEKDKFDANEELESKKDKKYVKKVFDPTKVSVDTSQFDSITNAFSQKQLTEEQERINELLAKHQDYNAKRLAIEKQYQKDLQELNKILPENRLEELGNEMVSSFGNGNVDLLARPLIDAAELVKKGWEEAGEGIATVFSSQFGIEDSSGKEMEILVTPIMPDGSILSPEELESYVDNILNGADDLLKADTKGIVISVGVSQDGTAGEKLHELQEQYYDLFKLSPDATKNIKAAIVQLEKDRKKSIKTINDEEAAELLKTTDLFVRLFTDASQQSVEQIRKVINEVQALYEYLTNTKDEDITDNFGFSAEDLKKFKGDAEKLKAILDGLNNKKRELAGKSEFQAFQQNMGDAINKIKKGLKGDEIGADGEVIATGAQNIGAGLTGIGSAINQYAPQVKKFGEDLATIFGDDKIAEDIGLATDAIAGLGTTAAGVGQIMSGDIIGGIQNVVSGVASLVTVFGKLNDRKKEKEIQKLQKQVELLEKSYQKLGRAIEKAYSKDASELIRQQNEALEKQKLLIQQQIRNEKDKKKPDKGRIKEWENQIEEINLTIENNKEKAIDAIFGQDIKSAIDDFASAYVDAWSAGEDRAKAMKDVVKKMIKGVIVEMLKSDLAPTVEKIRKKIQDYLTDGIIDATEQAELDRMIEEATRNADNKYGWADKYMEDAAAGREATAKGIATASQDSVDENNGRLTVIQSHTYELNENVKILRANSAVVLKLLAGIESNTSYCKRLEAIEEDMGAVREGISEINLHGITLKK